MQAFILLLLGMIYAFLLYLIQIAVYPWYIALGIGVAMTFIAIAAIYVSED